MTCIILINCILKCSYKLSGIPVKNLIRAAKEDIEDSVLQSIVLGTDRVQVQKYFECIIAKHFSVK